jgi:hypothetical protein
LKQVAAGLVQMGIGVALMETKFVDDRYPKMVAGYTIMSSKVASCAGWGGPCMEGEQPQIQG